MDFVHLHLHSEYSLLDGACRVKQIPKYASSLGQKAVAITDHGAMFGAVEFYKQCKKNDIKPIIGCEVYVAPGSRLDKFQKDEKPYGHLVLLCKNETGYKNLIYMVSKSYTEGFYYKPRIDNDLLSDYHEGLVCLSGCLAGYIPQMILRDDLQKAEELILFYKNLFGEDFYLELQDHDDEFQNKVNSRLIEFSQKHGIELVATNDVHYLSEDDYNSQKVLLCIQTNKNFDEPNTMAFEKNLYYMRSTEQMYDTFSYCTRACENTVVIANKCNFDFDFSKTYFPRVDINGKDPSDFLMELAIKGLEEKELSGKITYDFASKEEYTARIKHEHDIISSMGYCEYYLIVWDFVSYAHKANIPVGPGRGSGAGSLIAYLIGITDIDPIRFNLYFEAFLNPERISMPDFDIDFCYFRREEAVDYVKQKYGSEQVSKIITFGTLGAKAAIRDVSRIMGKNYLADKICALIPKVLNITLDECFEEQSFKDFYNNNADAKKIIDIAMTVEGMPRNMSTHAAGVVISDRAISDFVPLAVTGGIAVTQYDMNTIAELGLLKFDFLGLRYLTIIDSCVKSIKSVDEAFEIESISLNDKNTYDLISRGDTVGLFQLESSGMRKMLSEFKPSSIDDIMVAIALYRPGPAKFIDKFLLNKKTGAKVEYPVKELSQILDETHGCIVYQEQVMEIFMAIAGYSFGKADIVRRAISKKKYEVIQNERANFIKGCISKGVTETDAVNLFEDMIGFANYGFKKSHAAAYAILSYRTAYLKANYPQIYYSALLSSEAGNTEKTVQYIEDAKLHKVGILKPDINKSCGDFTIEEDSVRFGLSSIKGVGANYAISVKKVREDGAFTSFEDFIHRMSPYDTNKKQIESLIKAGAFDSLKITRKSLLFSYEKIIDFENRQKHANVSGQVSMFDFSSEEDNQFLPAIEHYDEYPEDVLLSMEEEILGMGFSKVTPKPKALGNAPNLPKSKKLYLRIKSFDCDEFKRIRAIINIFPGDMSVVIYNNETAEYTAHTKSCSADPFVISQIRQILGVENVVIK